jgi:hypothetical protein
VTALLVVLVASVVLIVLFIVTHLGPLSAPQVIALAMKQRSRAIARHLSFHPVEVDVDADFKRRMNPSGRLYPVAEPLSSFPAVAAGLLKYKKHEWIIIGFAQGSEVKLAWINKGVDRSRVMSQLPNGYIPMIATQEGCDSVMIFHNHPNSNPQYENCTAPSQTDRASAQQLAALLTPEGINLLEFVCERGRPYPYLRCVADAFMPLREFAAAVGARNGVSRYGNLALHWERIVS